ncbi:DUF1648 domain-containing protein [Halobellus rubicundus]|uniref:DUF1648 domain-containing protein n=1 Tax=Halobellus rubicundus TaxID=2996466 RepID=A0ABD5MBX0_9EURY
MRHSRLDVLSAAVLVGAAVVGIALLPSLPDRIAVHFGAGGSPDNYLSAPLGVVLVPAIGLVTLAAVRGLLPLGNDVPPPPWFGLALAGFLAYVHGVVLAWNLGYRVNVTLLVLPAVAVIVVLAFVIERR